MARPHDTMMNPQIESLLGLGAIVPPQVASVSRKPLSIAFEEISADKITYERTQPGQDELDVEAEVESAEEAPAE